MPSRAVFLLAATGLAASLATSAQGAITLLNTEFRNLGLEIFGPNNPDHSVIIGDKLFNFQAFTSAQFNQNNVFITAFVDQNNPNNGIGFDITGGFGDTIPGDGNISEFNLLYTVEVVPSAIAQGYRLKDIGLIFNGSATGAGSYSRVDETIINPFLPTGTNVLWQLQANIIPGSPGSLQDYHDFSPNTYTKFQVNKDLKFYAVGPNDQASASFIRQAFSQTIIPAPGAVALLGLGGLIAARRRRV